jgi:hypothetical protein
MRSWADKSAHLENVDTIKLHAGRSPQQKLLLLQKALEMNIFLNKLSKGAMPWTDRLRTLRSTLFVVVDLKNLLENSVRATIFGSVDNSVYPEVSAWSAGRNEHLRCNFGRF